MTSSAFSALSAILRNLTLLMLLFQVSFSGGLTAANDTQPNDPKELFQLEKLHLPRHSMKEISMQLVTLTQRHQKDTPYERRANAKLLALAIQIDPTNQTARKINKELSRQSISDFQSDSSITSTFSKIQSYQKWLATPEAGIAANQLAKYLSDATQILVPDQQNQPDSADSADWTGVIAPLSAYSARPQEITPKPDIPKVADIPKTTEKKATDPKKTENPKPDIALPSALKFHLANISIKTPIKTEKTLKSIDSKTKQTIYKKIKNFKSTPITIQFSPRPSSKKFEISFSSSLPWLPTESQRVNNLHNLTQPIIAALKIRHPKLPPQRATVKIDYGQYSPSNQQAITAPIAVMLEASLQNKPLRNDLQICAAINSKGELTQPKLFWKFINILRTNQSSGHLIVSPESASLLSQLLVYGELEFFTRWEIFTAKDLDQAIAAAAQEGTESLNQSSQLFKTIQDLSVKKNLHQLTNNKAVRKRLSEILKLSPNHLSARILLLQGSSQRPRKLNEVALAHELLPILNELQQTLLNDPLDTPAYPKLKKKNKDLRHNLTPFEKYIDLTCDDFYEETLKILNNFRRLVTLSRRIASADYDKALPLKKSATDLVLSMQRDCDELLKKIDLTISAPSAHTRAEPAPGR